MPQQWSPTGDCKQVYVENYTRCTEILVPPQSFRGKQPVVDEELQRGGQICKPAAALAAGLPKQTVECNMTQICLLQAPRG